jgi:hypothetical protein
VLVRPPTHSASACTLVQAALLNRGESEHAHVSSGLHACWPVMAVGVWLTSVHMLPVSWTALVLLMLGYGKERGC